MGSNPPLLCLSPVRFGAVLLAAKAAGSNGSDWSGAADQDAASQQNLAPWALGDPCPHIRDKLSWWEAQQWSQVLLNTGAAGRAESRGHCWTAPNWSTSASGLILVLGNQQLLPSPSNSSIPRTKPRRSRHRFQSGDILQRGSCVVRHT